MYILGDLFEAWIGDDAPAAPADNVAVALRELSDAGVKLYFVVGNRDFLLGPSYCETAGMTLLDEPVALTHHDRLLMLLHGDVLCTDDHEYQRFRRKARDPAWQQRMLARPVWLRRLLAKVARAISKRRNRGKPEFIMDVNPQAVASSLGGGGVSCMIHGHTHRPAIHRLDHNGQPALRAVLGDWHEERGSTIRLDQGELSLIDLLRQPGGEVSLQVRDSVQL